MASVSARTRGSLWHWFGWPFVWVSVVTALYARMKSRQSGHLTIENGSVSYPFADAEGR